MMGLGLEHVLITILINHIVVDIILVYIYINGLNYNNDNNNMIEIDN